MGFNDWYKLYPKKSAVGDARKAWKTLNPSDELIQKMILALEAQKRYARESGKALRFWKNPGPYIRQECWLDEIPSHHALREAKKREICASPECNNPALRNSLVCVECDQDRARGWKSELLKKHWIDMGRPRTREDCLPIIWRANPVIARMLGR